MFCDAFARGLRPKLFGLEAHRAFQDECAPGAPVMVAGLGVELRELIPHAVARGVHVRAGLEDAHFGETRSNRELIAELVARVETAGGRPASAAEVRADLKARG